MKNTNTCPICNSHNIIYDNQSNYLTFNNIQIFRIDRYVCFDCGYIEEWMNDLNKFNKEKEKYGTKL